MLDDDELYIPSEDQIHSLYNDAERDRLEKKQRYLRWVQESNNPSPLTGRQSFPSNPARFSKASFRSIYFNIGDSLKTVAPASTVRLASITIPSLYSGVLTGFSQYFAGCEEDIKNKITWGIRINGFPPQGFSDFIGEFSSLMLPHSVYFPLIGGSSTLGNTFTSIGGNSPIDSNDIPTIYMQATNHSDISVVLQGRLIGYMFPDAERSDEFANI